MPADLREGPGGARVKIGLVAHFAYGALAGRGRGHIGGVEKQTTMFARWLAARGHDVSLLTWDEGQREGEFVDGVRAVPMCAQRDGLPGLRFFHPRWTSLCRALRRVDADVYYQNCGEYVTGQVALWCRLHRRSFVYSAASDADCDPQLPLMPERRVRVLYRLGVRLADRVIVQTARQQRMLEDGFGRDAVVIPLPCARPGSPPRRPSADERRTVVWIGRLCEAKRPDRLLDVAALCPELRFVVVGPPDDRPDYIRAIAARAASLPNVTMHGAADRSAVEALLGASGCLCCTSDHEGFPNTFLEAWSLGRPIVSTWDPDDLIARHGLGIVARDADGIARGLRTLAASDAAWERLSAASMRYFDEMHAADRVLPRFERVLLDAGGRRPREATGDPLVGRVAG
jgi:glycosyltransferase involved in cell wall biosynthesis